MKLDANQFLKKLLSEHYVALKKKNARYSLRAFAKKLNCSPAALSEILKGKRQVSLEKALSFLEKIQADKKTSDQLQKLYDPGQSISTLLKKKSTATEVVLTKDLHYIVSDWRYSAVFSLLKLDSFVSDSAWMAKKIGLKKSEVEAILEKLLDLDMIYKDRISKKIIARKIVFRTGDEVPESISSETKIEALESGVQAIRRQSKGEFGFTSVGGYSPERLKASLFIIEDFVKRLSIFLSEDEKTEVFQLIVQVYPRSNVES